MAPGGPVGRASFLACAMLWSALSSSCGGKTPAGGGAAPGAGPLAARPADAPPGLAVKLSEGSARPARDERVRVAAATRLPEDAAQHLLARMPALVAAGQDKAPFALREKSPPPPRPGDVIVDGFPTSAARRPASRVEGGPLEVLRFAPTGEVPLAPHVSITFNQPLVAIGSHADTTAGGVPARLTPRPPGKWRWVGTRTLLFDPDGRLPAATRYTVDVPAGTRSASGSVLKRPLRFRFATPAPVLAHKWPGSSETQRRDPLLFAAFDQSIDAEAVLATIRLKFDGGAARVRAATRGEIAASPEVTTLVEGEQEADRRRRHVAFKPVAPLPGDSTIQVVVGPGTPSAEGPRRTTAPQGWSFRTFGPLRVVEQDCAAATRCPPSDSLALVFNNLLDEKAFDRASVRVEPAPPGLEVTAMRERLVIHGSFEPRGRYRVTLPAGLRDTFGQALGAAQTFTFRIGDPSPELFGSSGLVVLDPASPKPTYTLHSINIPSLDVAVYRVAPNDWPSFVSFQAGKGPPPGAKVFERTIPVSGSSTELVETAIDLAPALSASGLGHAVIRVEPTRWPDAHKPDLHAWVQGTEIALDAFVDASELLAWASRLDDGTPLAGVQLSLQGARRATGPDGTAALALPAGGPRGPQVLIGRKGDDVAILPESAHGLAGYGGWRRQAQRPQLAWFVYDDRGMYRPGEQVHLKGWLRVLDPREGGDVTGLAGLVERVTFKVVGPRGNDLATGVARVNALGGFDAAFTLPKTPNLGDARVELRARGKRAGSHTHRFQIEEFRRPEYEVSAAASEGPHVVGGAADVTVEAAYYAGGGLAGADVAWSVTSSPTSFTPPGRDGYVFGTFEPWWTDGDGESAHHRHDRLTGATDANGRHVLHIDFLSVNPARPMSLVAEAAVQDVNRQSWAASAALIVHPSELYVGLDHDRMFVDQGEPIEVKALAVDQEGAAVPGTAIDMTAVRLDWTFEKGELVEKEVDPQPCRVVAAETDRTCTFDTPEGGAYRVRASVIDRAGRPNQSQIMVWVAGGARPPLGHVAEEEVVLVPDAREYRPGQKARLLVQSPFFPAHGLLSVRRSGIVDTRSFEMKGPTTTVEVPIVERHVPNLTVQVDLVGSAARLGRKGKPDDRLPRRPAYGKGSIDLQVPPVTRSLKIDVAPRARRLEPGGQTQVDVAVRDAGGRAVAGAELAVVVVDEAVLALSGYTTPDPLGVFYAARPPGATDHHIREHVSLARLAGEKVEGIVHGGVEGGVAGGVLGGVEGGLEGNLAGINYDGEMIVIEGRSGEPPAPPAPPPPPGADAGAPIGVRKQFGALAVFAPEVKTDAGGRASLAVKLPDNLTRYRVMVAAVAGDKQFGAGESSITARMPLMVRPSPPRFLQFGDRFELPIVVQNQTDRALAVDLAVRASNAALTAGSGRRVTVPANQRVEVRLPAAAQVPGTARFQIAAASGSMSDAAELDLPVWTPATSEAFAVHGEIDRGALRQKIAVPKEAVVGFGGLEVGTSSTQLQALTDAVLYLVDYPFECAEQVSSRVLAVAALRDVLGAFAADGLPGRKELERAVGRDIDKLRALQNGDGGFAFWQRGHQSWPYLSIHAGHALVRARQKGFDVPADMLARNRVYLRTIEKHLPWHYPAEVKRSLRAYAVYVRKRMGDRDAAAEAHLIVREGGGADQLPLEALAWVYATLAGDGGSEAQLRAIRRALANRASETAATAHFAADYQDRGHLLLQSDRRADGILLEALIDDQPGSDLIPKLARGLLAHRVRGRWASTQDNAFVLLALDRYFRAYEAVTPDFVARAWLGDGYAGEHRFAGRRTDTHRVEVPMSYLATMRGGTGDLVLRKDGAGRLYYRIAMTYAPASLRLAPEDRGFAVERAYEAVDDAGDVVRDRNGSWTIRAGAQVRVRLTMATESRRYHVALVDSLPAGLEPMNPALAVTGAIPQDPNARRDRWWWGRTWYEHQNLRDERVEAFASLLEEGVHEYTYVARATTPGHFIAPPARAEEMYEPDTSGRSGTDRVSVR